ncbi:MAG: ribonuclease HI family protein [Candidatus Levybacteria bacterium]|nr:ribonuclease HI family protein [Candidatus Levybacteria bacterium]
MINIFTDGGSRGNPGPAALGVHMTKDNQPLVSFGKTLGIATNNIAEYSAAVAALTWIVEHKETLEKDEEIFFYADSQLLISQIMGVYRIKSAPLAALLMTIRDLEIQIGHPIHYRHIPREQNKLADKQVNLALDNQK